jgi:alkylhydroperoxidase family enzyme
MPEDDKKRAAHRALVDRILNGAGQATAGQRARAFGNDGLAPPLDVLIGKVATSPAQVTEADFAAARSAGFTEDQLFELVVCAAVGRSSRLSAFCVGAHTATASLAYRDAPKVAAVLADPETAPVEEPLRATLRMLGTLTAEGSVSAADMRAVPAAGASPQQAEDALAVCAAFDTTNRPRRRVRLRGAEPRGLRGRRQVPAQTRLPLADRPQAHLIREGTAPSLPSLSRHEPSRCGSATVRSRRKITCTGFRHGYRIMRHCFTGAGYCVYLPPQ